MRDLYRPPVFNTESVTPKQPVGYYTAREQALAFGLEATDVEEVLSTDGLPEQKATPSDPKAPSGLKVSFWRKLGIGM